MNDKQQLAAMGYELRLTEEQAKGPAEALAGRMPQTGVLHVIDDEPLRMAKRIEELEAQMRVMGSLLSEAKEDLESEWSLSHSLRDRIDVVLSGKLPESSTPEGWQLVPVSPTQEMVESGLAATAYEGDSESCILAAAYRAMLAAAPKPEDK